jgi:nicotinamide-nucleotide amidase
LPQDLSDEADEVMRALADRKLRIATAESCTGGLLAALLTDIEGAAHAFDRGVVTYSDDAKVGLLGLDRSLLGRNDAVSEAVARAMAEGILQASGAELGIAITGFAGPGKPGTEEGLVHFALAGHGMPTAHRVEHFGPLGRGGVRISALRTALEMIGDAVATPGDGSRS